MNVCIFHSDKTVFDNVRKDLQKAHILPRKYGSRLAMAVCSCRRKGSPLENLINEDLTDKLHVILKETSLPKWNTYPDTKAYLENLLNSSFLSVSQRKLVLVIDKALEKNYDVLKAEFKKEKLEEMNKIKKPKFNHIGLANIIKKKKKKYPVVREAILPIFGGSTKKLEKDTGKGFIKTGKDFDCIVRFDSDKTKEFMNKNIQKTAVTVWCTSMESYEAITKHLQSLAKDIQTEERKAHQKKKETVKHLKIVRRSYTVHDVPGSDVRDPDKNLKDNLAEDFSKKSFKDRKHKSYHRVNKEELSPLKGGHCINCFKEFDNLKTAQSDNCRYHPGYQKFIPDWMGWMMTCCKLDIPGKVTQPYQLHRDSGCSTGRHVWRPHAKASRGDKSERMYWQRVLKRK